MMEERHALAAVFEDTMRQIRDDETLNKAAADSAAKTVLYREGEAPALPAADPTVQTTVTVNGSRTFEAVGRLRKEWPAARIGVLNFASATTPGGGVKNGARAQEEALCRCSTLYPALAQKWLWDDYYQFHRTRDARYTDAVIYTPDVRIIKSDTRIPQRLAPQDWGITDVLTCAAPNLRNVSVTPAELAAIHERRGRQILTVAAAHGVEILVLGAFGCGAFRNDPMIVAEAYRRLLPAFEGQFRQIVFAVYCPPHDPRNLEAFEQVFGR